MKDSRRSWPLLAAACALAALVLAPTAQASIPTSLKTNCSPRTPHPGYSFTKCDDGTPPVAGVTPNVGGVSAVRVPAKYDGHEGLPAKAADAASMPGADADGMLALDVNVSIPTVPAPPGGYPMIVMMHGCCQGTKTSWESDTSFESTGERWHYNNAWFASRGYVVVTYTARGFREGSRGSTGETQLDSREFEINDFQYLAGEIADDPFFNVDPQKVVPTGGSYGGGFAWLALTDPIWDSPGGKRMKLAVSAPRYGWTDLVYSLVPNGKHFLTPDRLPAFDGSDSTSPVGSPKSTVLTLLFVTGLIGNTFPQYILDAFDCLNSADPFETNPLCTGTLATTLPSFIADRSAYYQNQFFSRIASDPSYRIPVFNAGTFSDQLFTAVENLRMSNRLQSVVPNYPIQQYFGDYQHFSQNKVREWADICGADRHVCRFADYPLGNVNAEPLDLERTGVTTRLNRFIDHYAQPPGNASEPQPRFDVTASLQICPENAGSQPANEPGPTFTAARFPDLAPYTLRIDRSGAQTTRNPATVNPHAEAADPLNNLINNGSRCPVFTTPAGPDEATYDGDPLTETATMIGGARVFVDYAASTAEGLQLNARLVDVFPDGKGVMVDRGVRRVTSQSGTVEIPLQGNGWRFEPGHKIRVEITQDDYGYVKASSVPSTATIAGVRIRMPVREPQPPALEDYKNASKFCKAEREFFGEQAFGEKYGAGRGNAHGKCVSQNN